MSFEGLQIGRYRLLSLVGSGNMGEVYLAEDTQLNRQVAIKVTRNEAAAYPDATATKEAARLFLREAKAIASLDHPYILPLFDYGEEIVKGSTLIYMVMPLRKEGSFADWLQQRDQTALLSPRESMHFIGQAADALQHAHDQQITHQDVKPSNFLVRSSHQKPDLPDLQLADFGIAKFTRATAKTSLTIRGTPAYMAPEQWSGNPTPASDQYALAIMTYELLTGRLPFQGGLEQMMYQHLQVQPQPPSKLNQKLSSEVDRVLLQALAKAPEARFASVSAFAHALQQALLHEAPGSESTYYAPTLVRTPPPPLINRGDSPMSPHITGTDIQTTLAISTIEAQNGTRRTLTLPDGRQISVAVPAGAYNGQVLRLEGLGQVSPYGGMPGALLLSLAVTQAEGHTSFSDATNLPTVAAYHPVQAPAVPPPPYPVAAPPAQNAASSQSRGFPRGVVILLIVLALLAGIGGGSLFYANLTKSNSPALTPTAGSNTGSPQAQNTPTNSSNPTATTTTQANPTATAASQNPYTHSGTLVLNDPLTDNSKGYNWQTGTNSNGATCEFRGGAYHATQPKAGFFHSCTAYNTDYSNFAFEVQMTMISGDYAGIIFSKATPDTYYLFRVFTNGNYDLSRSVDANFASDAVKLTSGTVALNSTNLIAVVVQNGTISLYLNRELLNTVNDSTLLHGQIAVLTGNNSNSADTAFNNAKVWSL